MSDAEKQTHARKLNMARRHLTHEQKRVLIHEQLKATSEQSDSQIAQALGVHQSTVGNQRRELERAGEVSKLDMSTGADGKTYPRIRKPVSVCNPTKREERAMKKPEVVERMQEDGVSPLVASMKVLSEAKAERKYYELSADMP